MLVSCRLGVIPTTLLALIITLVLVFFPRSPETPLPFKEIEVNHQLIKHRGRNTHKYYWVLSL